jgi:hypothetical protein
MTGIVAQTNYATVPNGGLDALWAHGGRQAAATDRIGAEADPKGGSFRVQRHTLRDGDVVLGGERCEVLSGDIGVPEGGGPVQFGSGILLDKAFNTSASGWNACFQFHAPNNGPEQTNWSMNVVNGNELWVRILGGPVVNGRPQIQHDAVVATISKWEWHDIWVDVLFAPVHGRCQIWVDGKSVSPVEWMDISTLHTGPLPSSQYYKQGMYRNASDSGTNTIWYKDVHAWNDPTPAAMLAFYGDVTPPIPPDPVPTNAELRDAAVAELRQTTVGYQNKYWQVPPPGTHWQKALDLLSKIK